MLKYLKSSEANSAKKMTLDSDEGDDFHLMVMSIYCDEYRANKQAVLAASAASRGKGDFQSIHSKLVGALINKWKVPKEYGKCTPKNVEKFLNEYPQIADAVDLFSSQNDQFIEKKSQA